MSSSARQWTPPPAQSLRRLRVQSRWWRYLPVVLLLGLLAVLRVCGLARLSELDWENRRVERLIHAQEMRRGELLRQRAQLTSNERLMRLAAQAGMVAPAVVKPLYLSAIPLPKIYWELPDENAPASPLNGQMLGFLPPSAPSSHPGVP